MLAGDFNVIPEAARRQDIRRAWIERRAVPARERAGRCGALVNLGFTDAAARRHRSPTTSTRSGTTRPAPGRRTTASASITSCCRRRRRTCSPRRRSRNTCGRGKAVGSCAGGDRTSGVRLPRLLAAPGQMCLPPARSPCGGSAFGGEREAPPPACRGSSPCRLVAGARSSAAVIIASPRTTLPLWNNRLPEASPARRHGPSRRQAAASGRPAGCSSSPRRPLEHLAHFELGVRVAVVHRRAHVNIAAAAGLGSTGCRGMPRSASSCPAPPARRTCSFPRGCRSSTSWSAISLKNEGLVVVPVDAVALGIHARQLPGWRRAGPSRRRSDRPRPPAPCAALAGAEPNWNTAHGLD